MQRIEKTVWNFEDSCRILKEKFGDRIEINRPLAELNTFGTGGSARLYMEVKSADELSELTGLSANLSIPLFLLGGGSNLLISDSGFNGLVIRNRIIGLSRNGNNISAGTGEKLENLIEFATENELTGLEFASGIWGSVGGAIFGNAGAYGGEIGQVLVSAQLVDRQGNMRELDSSQLDFSYRSSGLKVSGEFATGAIFALKKGKKDDIQCKIDEILAIRKKKLPYGKKTAGCIFKNIPDKNEKYGKLSVGKLLEDANAKSLRVGDVRVYENHANILVNDGSAKSEDIKRLADLMKAKVKEKFGIDLKEEIILLGEFS